MKRQPPKPTRQATVTLDMPFDEALQRFARINTRETPQPYTVPGEATPFVKWAGGKRSIIQELTARLPAKFGTYYEPFAGGAALFFEIHPRLTEAILSDSNFELVTAFNVVKRDPEALLARLEEHARKHDSAYYYKIRKQHELQDPIEIAARFIYLNRTCYNGLYRVNKSGEFNVPVGSYVEPNIVQRENILACSAALQKARIEYREFDTITPQAGDFVYCDPPYHPAVTNGFTKYTKLAFSEKDQARLRDFAAKLHKAGILMMLSNSDTPFIRSLYEGAVWRLTIVQAPRLVNCKPDGRGAVNELVITNYPLP